MSDIELNPIVLGPCLRDGEPGDWWGKKCTQCTASHHTPLGIVKCACPRCGRCGWRGIVLPTTDDA